MFADQGQSPSMAIAADARFDLHALIPMKICLVVYE
jgi:hypothetical protein